MLRVMEDMAVDSLAFVTGGAPVVNAAKEFDRFMKSYEFAIEAQQLKREDVRDLVELIVDRMDMYHLIGALLLEFCVAFYGEFKLLEEEYAEEPLFVLEIFLLSNISAIGYLLFAVWLSLHASVAAHAIGVEFLLESSRLTIPSPENLREMRQSTSLFRQIYGMFEEAARNPQAARARAQQASLHPDSQMAPLMDVGLTAGAGRFPLALEQAMDPMEHRHRFAESHRSWLRFDAYSRVCMALGINQMLQAMAYFIIGPIQQRRPTSALLTLVGIQAIALLLLKLDLRKTDIEEDTFMLSAEEQSVQDSDSDGEGSTTAFMRVGGSKDVSRTTWCDLWMVLSTYSLAPLWTTLMLWLNRFIEEDRHQHYLLYSVTPVFFLHALWLTFVLRVIRPHEGDLLPLRLRTVGYLDIFTKDLLNPGDPLSPRMAKYDEGTPHGHRTLVGQRKTAVESAMSAESVPWLVVNRFTRTMIFMWIGGGSMHFFHTALKATMDVDFETTPNKEDPDDEWEEEALDAALAENGIENGLESEGAGSPEEVERRRQRRRLLATAWPKEATRLETQWPSPAGFFEVSGLHCNDTHLHVRSPFRVYTTAWMRQERSVGPLAEAARLEAAAVMCGIGRCDALARAGLRGSSAWVLRSLGAPRTALGAPVPIPEDWRLASGAWVPCHPGTCEEASLAGWDGSRISVGGMRRASPSDAWRFRKWFFLDFGEAFRKHCDSGNGEGAGQLQCTTKDMPPSMGELILQALDHRRKGKAAKDPAEDLKDVVSLQLDPGQKTLAVLHRLGSGSLLTVWDLEYGSFIGKWQTNGPHSAMCFTSRELLLAGAGGVQGPVLESLRLPARLRRRMAAAEVDNAGRPNASVPA